MVGATGIEPVATAMSRLGPVDFIGFCNSAEVDTMRTVVERTGTNAQIARNAKCASCGRMYVEHTAGGHYCPIGAKHRTLGFVQFSPREQFTAIDGRSRPERATPP